MVDKTLYNEKVNVGVSNGDHMVNYVSVESAETKTNFDINILPQPVIVNNNIDISQLEKLDVKKFLCPTEDKEEKDDNIINNSELNQNVPDERTRSDIEDENAIAGVCGLNNLGNTCFMNAAIQCVLSSSTIKTVLSSNTLLNNKDEIVMQNQSQESALFGFIERLREIHLKMLHGKYVSLYPKEFHTAVGKCVACFADYKQHDSQEFLSFVLNALHDCLSKTIDNVEHNMVGSPRSIEVREGYKKLKIDQESIIDTEVNSAKEAWRKYRSQNCSVIVDDFQGQFKSDVTCKICSFVSTSYEPFMMLSLPIPYAMEKQFEVTWLQSPQHSALPGMSKPIRFVVTISKNGAVKDIRRELLKLLKNMDSQLDTSNILLAEASSSAHPLILDDHTLVSYIGKSKTLYAHELIKIASPFIIDIAEKDNNELEQQDPSSQDAAPSVWHSCNICFDEIFDEELKVHLICGGLLCHTCLESTAKYGDDNGKFHCPTCNRYISIGDYVNFAEPSDGMQKATRQVLVPIMFRKPSSENDNRKFNLFAHPHLCQLPSETTPSQIIEIVNLILRQWQPVINGIDYDILLTDGSGLSCGSCDRMGSCNGCSVKQHEKIMLKPGVCITIHFADITSTLHQLMESFIKDVTCSSLRTSDSVTLNECIDKFAEIEHLSDANPWYCERCKCDQPSIKAMSVTRWPTILIIHLKRFYFEGSVCCKIDSPVEFPEHQLNVGSLCSADSYVDHVNNMNGLPNYDLYASIEHVGSLYGGHYTAVSKKYTDWYLFNDESFEKTNITGEDYKKAYVLFYHNPTPGFANMSIACSTYISSSSSCPIEAMLSVNDNNYTELTRSIDSISFLNAIS